MASTFEFYSLGYLVEDVVKDDPYVKVNPIEVLPTTQGNAATRDGNSGTFKNSSGGVDNFSANKSGSVTAKYIPLGSPNGGVPMLHSGEMVLLCRYGGGDHFMWIPCSNSIKDRTTEYFLLMASAKSGRGSTAGSGDTYYVKGDSGDKYLRMHTSKANGEVAGYDIELNGKDGLLTITDDMGNDIVISSTDGKMTLTASNDVILKSKSGIANETKAYTIKCASFSVSNGANELIGVLTDLIEVLKKEVHIDSMGGNTRVSGGTTSELNDIQSRLEGFK